MKIENHNSTTQPLTLNINMRTTNWEPLVYIDAKHLYYDLVYTTEVKLNLKCIREIR